MVRANIQHIVQQAFSSRILTSEQEDTIHQLLQKQQYSSADLEALEQLTDYLLSGKIIVRHSYQAS
jgi:hypothetical protein